jgi:hypothetical protein
MLQKYDNVIKDQLSQGIVEKAAEEADGREFYIWPHKPVVRESAETTKFRIVLYDDSARENEKAPSLPTSVWKLGHPCRSYFGVCW